MDFKNHLETAWKQTIKFIAPLILMTLVMYIVSIITLGILAPVAMAGYMQAILLMIREGREPKVNDVFSQMKLFLPLIGFTIVVTIATIIGFMLLILPGLIIIIIVAFGCLYTMPLMTDKSMGLIDAVKESFSMSLKKDILNQVIIVIIFFGISAIGGSVFIGWLFTQPLATIFLLSVYEEKAGMKKREPELIKE